MFGLGMQELLVILVIALIVVGPKQLRTSRSRWDVGWPNSNGRPTSSGAPYWRM
jgi:hypothetical protein